MVKKKVNLMASTFEQNLQTYADLVVKVGLNIRPGQRLVIRAPIETAPAIRLVAASAYRAGARLVDVMWSDEAITLTRFNYAPRDSFEEFPTWRTDGLLQAVQRGDAMLSVRANNPDLLAGQDPELISTAMQTAQKHMLPALEYTMRDAVNWLVIGVPTPDWAAKIFPTLKPDAQLQRLWDTIFDVCRINR
ncbi:MAG: aminopeptidase, partial [Anaerolineae bacterium]